uniref:UBX domain-containing protein 11 n=1 Tax=Pavo cristatus TaxID=9049 RepID=A0A8C9G3Q8_PAVCR
MSDGLFRSYEELSAQQCLQDIMDGYFPSEFQARYPDGVPLQVTDKRGVVFQERDLPGSFPGHGQVVGHSKLSKAEEPTEIPGKFLHLSRKCISQREELKPHWDGFLTSRLETAEEAEASAPDVCTLRIKSESGEQMYVIKMLFSETIGDLRQHLTHARGGDSDSYEIISTFPQRVYADNSRSLQECGLIPSASLLLRRRDHFPQEGTGLQTPPLKAPDKNISLVATSTFIKFQRSS